MSLPSPPSRWPSWRRACLAASVLALAALVVALARLNIDRTPNAAAGAANLRALWPFWLASAAGWAALSGVALSLRGRRGRANPHGRVRRILILLGVALAARVAVLIVHEPTLSDDIHRYVLDGRTLAAGFNPYLDTPQERADALAAGGAERFAGEAELLPRVNNAEMHTIYLPTSQWCFGVAGWLVPRAWSSPAASGRLFRGLLVGVEMLLIVMLLVAAARSRRSAWWVALYAWHPLAISEVAGSGHQDVLGIVLLVAALLMWGTRPRRYTPWTTLLALAALVKPVVVPVAGILLRGRPLGKWTRCALLGALVCLLVGGPLWFTHRAEPAQNLLETTSRFGRKWAHFGSVYEPVLWTIEQATNDPDEWRRAPERTDLWSNDRQEIVARAFCLVLLAVVILALWATKLETWAACRVLFLVMVLLSSTAHPWYLLWVLALVPRAFGAAAWVATLTLPWGYAQLADVVEWHTPAWVMVLAYVPIYGTLLADAIRRGVHDER